MERLLVFLSLRDPEDIVVFPSIEVADVDGNDVVFVAGRTFEGEFTFDCYLSALGVKGR